MTIIRKAGAVFVVDLKKTQDYYRDLTVCECDACQCLHSGIRGRFPALETFLADFGVDITRFDEAVWFVERDGAYSYDSIGYTVCGSIVHSPKHRIELDNGISVSVNSGFSFPNEQKGDYFSLSIYGVSLPSETARMQEVRKP